MAVTSFETQLVLVLAFVLAALLFIWPDNRAWVRSAMIEAWASIRAVLVARTITLTGLFCLLTSVDAVFVTIASNSAIVRIIKAWLNALFDNFFIFD